MKSWKTTLGGSLVGLGLAVTAIDPEWTKTGLLIAALGGFANGLFGRDNDRTSEQVHAGNPPRKKLPLVLLALALAGLVLAGCLSGCAVRVPATKIKLGSLVVEGPKDQEWEDVEIQVHPDGSATLKAKKIVSKNSPESIAAAAASQAASAASIASSFKSLEEISKRVGMATATGGLAP